jgi:signal transduction histidine kinase
MTRTIVFAIGATILALLSGSIGLTMLQQERDRSRQRELQLELAHMARLNTMGETAAMLAHELNQPLTAANNHLSAVQALTQAAASPASDRVIDIVGRATAQLERAGDILRRLRGFVQKSEPTKSLEDLSTLFEDAIIRSPWDRQRHLSAFGPASQSRRFPNLAATRTSFDTDQGPSPVPLICGSAVSLPPLEHGDAAQADTFPIRRARENPRRGDAVGRRGSRHVWPALEGRAHRKEMGCTACLQ